jgi:hypothetical protein
MGYWIKLIKPIRLNDSIFFHKDSDDTFKTPSPFRGLKAMGDSR